MVMSDYSVVIQAALLSQGVALGWVNVVSRLLGEGLLVPFGRPVPRSGRDCALVRRVAPRNPVVPAICDWIAARYADDLRVLAGLYPRLFDGPGPASAAA